MKNQEFLDIMRDKVKVYDLTMPLSIHTPPWPSYMPLQIQYFKRLAGCNGGGMGANGQVIKMSNHVGTHMDGEIHFCANGRAIGEVPLEEWIGPGAVVDISEDVEDYGIYTPDLLMSKCEIQKGDILVINTGYHKYDWTHKTADEIRYFVKHPGPSPDFHKWALEMKIKWIGVDCGSADHPFNTIIRQWQPEHFQLADALVRERYNKSWDELYPIEEYYQAMHLKLFPAGIVHAECLGGDIAEVGSKRLWIGAFPWRAIEMESCGCRIIAFDTEA